MLAPYVELDWSTNVIFDRRLLFSVINNTQHQPLQRLASYQCEIAYMHIHRLRIFMQSSNHEAAFPLRVQQIRRCTADSFNVHMEYQANYFTSRTH